MAMVTEERKQEQAPCGRPGCGAHLVDGRELDQLQLILQVRAGGHRGEGEAAWQRRQCHSPAEGRFNER